MKLNTPLMTGAALTLGIGVAQVGLAAQAPAAAAQPPAVPPLTLTTTAFADGGVIPNKYTQAGEQVSPALAWTNVPAGTQSFVLHMRDPDVARNKTSEDQYGRIDEVMGEFPAYLQGVVRQAHLINAAVHQKHIAYPVDAGLA